MVRVGGIEDQKYHACTKNQRERERDHIKRFRGRLRALKLSTNALMDFIEQRSSFRTSTWAASLSLRISCLASFAASMFLAAMTTWAFRRAKTLAVSKPIPLAPPTTTFASSF